MISGVKRCNLRSFNAVLNNRNVTSREREFLFVLCFWANDQGVCFPSNALLQKYCNASERTVQNVQVSLEKKGELEIDYESSPLGTNMLRIVCVGGAPLQKKGRKPVSAKSKGGAKSEPKVAPKVSNAPHSNIDPVPDPVPIPNHSHEVKTEKLSNREQAARLDESGNTAKPGWPAVQAEIQKRIDPHTYEVWYAPTREEDSRDGILRVSVPTDWFRDYLRAHQPMIFETARAVVPGVRGIVWTVPEARR